ncbi:HAD-IA family hydrolase [Polyangium sp. 15x6]|uniref:HAD family hydrolase n=1 Tax=Polyangium sp. 15x6 TaxID=3042687 RepID=UPI00249C3B4B|nr:HAD-IA family hydrolase [Polyangium sp. 15x6]MDI3290521.1 HAD-IA family hydrolase [Polyangium sp. 15x6]
MSPVLPPTAVVFDLDGTLLDSRGDIVAALNHALLTTGRSPQPAQVIVRLVGDGSRALCARAAKIPEDAPEVDELVRLFLDYYKQHPLDFTRWAKGALEAIEALASMENMALGICTNKHRSATDVVLRALGIEDRFGAIVAGGDTKERKPDAAPLLLAAKQLGAMPAAVVMVGDGPQDILCARNAGTWAVGVESGFSTVETLVQAGPDVTVRDLSMLPGIVQRWREPTTKIKLR